MSLLKPPDDGGGAGVTGGDTVVGATVPVSVVGTSGLTTGNMSNGGATSRNNYGAMLVNITLAETGEDPLKGTGRKADGTFDITDIPPK